VARFGLEDEEDEEDELRIVVRGEKYGESQGSDVSITHLTVFRLESINKVSGHRCPTKTSFLAVG